MGLLGYEATDFKCILFFWMVQIVALPRGLIPLPNSSKSCSRCNMMAVRPYPFRSLPRRGLQTVLVVAQPSSLLRWHHNWGIYALWKILQKGPDAIASRVPV
jgi:hypothetical protein